MTERIASLLMRVLFCSWCGHAWQWTHDGFHRRLRCISCRKWQ